MNQEFLRAAVCVLMGLVLTGCAHISDRNTKRADLMFGVVRYIELEGGFYVITIETGENLVPTNLDDAYKKDGLRIRFACRILERVMTTVMSGKPVEITFIEKAP
jgi:hypothetical protein